MNSYDSVTSHRRLVVLTTLLALAFVTFFGMSLSAAQDGPANDPVLIDAPSGPDGEVAELVLQLEERDARIAVLHQQLAFMQQAALSTEQRVDDQRDRDLDNQIDLRVSEAFQVQSMEEWRIGYELGGGQKLASFESTILPCESGGQPDPDAAVGPTDDWGRAQINRPTWSARFTELTGASFEENIGTPILNGFMAAHVESEQGLSAWTCWRKR